MTQVDAPPHYLWVYDIEGWAIHNVGMSWQRELEGMATLEFMSIEQAVRLTLPERSEYRDFILGFSSLLDGPAWLGLAREEISFAKTGHALARELRLLKQRWFPRDDAYSLLRTSLSVVHDPIEVYPQAAQWRHRSPWLSRVRQFRRLGVTSLEMFEMLRSHGVASTLVNTKPDVSIRSTEALVIESARPLSICADYPRKNLPLLRELERFWNRTHAATPFMLVVGRGSRSRAEYQALLDAHNIYVCTSWQEGGPLPLMEAVCRGHVILSTAVGQVDRWLIHGVNGFVCQSREEFEQALQLLRDSPQLLQQMRIASLEIAERRQRDPMRAQICEFLQLP